MLEPVTADGTPVNVLKVQLETLGTFKKKIDDLLDSMDKSQAGPRNIGNDKLQPHHLGTGFPQAEDLNGAYTHVHGQLETFSQLLSDQMQAMQLSIEGASTGYQNMDLEQRQKIWSIRDATSSHYHQHHATATNDTQSLG
jgi:hypothetical protein